jgi:hypothetical protein
MQAQRAAAIRIIRSYRTVSDVAALVLARMPPTHLLATERLRIAEARQRLPTIGVSDLQRRERMETLRRWQCLWESSPKSSWTRKLIPDVSRWYYSAQKVVDFHLAQALTDHGCFQSYLHRRKRAADPTCCHCWAAEDTAEHTLFVCPWWSLDREPLRLVLRRPLMASDVEDLLCGPRHEDLPSEVEQRNALFARRTITGCCW